jgi:hypothetical protein
MAAVGGLMKDLLRALRAYAWALTSSIVVAIASLIGWRSKVFEVVGQVHPLMETIARATLPPILVAAFFAGPFIAFYGIWRENQGLKEKLARAPRFRFSPLNPSETTHPPGDEYAYMKFFLNFVNTGEAAAEALRIDSVYTTSKRETRLFHAVGEPATSIEPNTGFGFWAPQLRQKSVMSEEHKHWHYEFHHEILVYARIVAAKSETQEFWLKAAFDSPEISYQNMVERGSFEPRVREFLAKPSAPAAPPATPGPA